MPAPETPDTPQVIIVGAGLAGLACARELQERGIPFAIHEAAETAGGRVRTDELDGFLLDRGFQVFLPAYPEARRVLDYDALDLRRFYRGADVILPRSTARLADPFRHPLDGFRALTQGLLRWRDAWSTILLKRESKACNTVPRDNSALRTEDYLRALGFSGGMIDSFFRPFFGGIFLEKDLRTSAAMFRFLFSMFDQQGAALPARGMGEIPRQLAAGLPRGSLHLRSPVAAVEPGRVHLAGGESRAAPHIVLATTQAAAHRLLPPQFRAPNPPRSRSVTCIYFASSERPCRDGILVLDGHGRGPVNNACCLSNVSSHYAPPGQHLVSASIIGLPTTGEVESEVRPQLARWFGPQVAKWRHIRTYKIEDAQPEDTQLRASAPLPAPLLAPGLWLAGDYTHDVSINGALLSGARTAGEIARELR
jgi:phytoene dehydrogenase-like protein